MKSPDAPKHAEALHAPDTPKPDGYELLRVRTEVNSPVSFLEWFRPGGPWVLTSIVPDKGTSTSTFRADQKELLEKWIAAKDGVENIYFQVAETGTRNITKKTRRDDITGSKWVWVDVDPSDCLDRDEIITRLETFHPRPSLVIDSGGGYQAFWQISLCDDLDDLEAINRWLSEKLGGDNCHNADRIMRLPGTTNVPNKKKRKAGRVATPASVVWWEDTVFSLGDFGTGDKQAVATRLESVDDLDRWTVPSKTKMVIVQGHDPDEPNKHPSRSEWFWYVICELARCEVPPGVIKSVVLDEGFEISEHVRDQKSPETYADRQIAKALEQAEGPKFSPVQQDGTPVKGYHNAREALKHLGLDIWHNVFTDRHMIEGLPIQDYVGQVSDEAMVVVRDMVVDRFGFDPGKEPLYDAFASLAVAHRRDPVVDFLDGLHWDGVERLDTWLVQTYGAEDNRYTREVGRLVLRAMCRRAREPGVKFDHMIVLEGSQGTGKSLSLSILAGGEHFSDAPLFSANAGRDRGEILQGNWINEVAELQGMKKGDVEDVKAFITQRADEFRAAYARMKAKYPRRGILVGTTNEKRWNKDPTGARRFLPVPIGRADIGWLRENRDQLLAEADVKRAGQLWLSDEVAADAELLHAERREAHSWDDKLEDFLPEQVSGGYERVSTRHLLDVVLELPDAVKARADTTSVLGVRMRLLGWDGPKPVRFESGRRAKGYTRPTDQPDQVPGEVPF